MRPYSARLASPSTCRYASIINKHCSVFTAALSRFSGPFRGCLYRFILCMTASSTRQLFSSKPWETVAKQYGHINLGQPNDIASARLVLLYNLHAINLTQPRKASSNSTISESIHRRAVSRTNDRQRHPPALSARCRSYPGPDSVSIPTRLAFINVARWLSIQPPE
jgi:hypothetical protein